MNIKYIIIFVCLLISHICCASSGSKADNKCDGNEIIKESSAVQLITGNKNLSMRCCVVQRDSMVVLQARILKGDFAVQVLRPSMRLTFDNGESITLKPENKSLYCGDWAAGRWNNVSFRLTTDDVEIMKNHNIVSIFIPTGKDEGMEHNLVIKKQSALGRLLRSIE